MLNDVLRAEFTIWPIIVIWAIVALFGSSKKKGGARPSARPPVRPSDAPEPGLFSELSRALEELKRAELEARTKRAGATEADRARAYLEQRKLAAAPRTALPAKPPVAWAPKPRPAAAPRRRLGGLPDDDADMSSEDPFVVSLEGAANDAEEAERLVEARIRAADRGVRRDESSEDLTSAQLARRGERVAEAIGGKAEHDAFHRRRDAQAISDAQDARPRGRAARRNPLARFAAGRTRDAVVLSDILGPPLGLR